MSLLTIAIDGPAGAGKSTIAKIIAKKLKITYLDTGAMYRAFTYLAIEENVAHDDKEGIDKLLGNTKIDISYDEIYINDKNVTKEIRYENIDKNVSNYAAIKQVREKMVDLQREIASGKSVIMDGRDIGSVVLPDAKFKFYLDATPEERAKRRYLQNKQRGKKQSYDEILEDIKRRDKIDSTREESPLVVAKDAIVIDSSSMTVNQTVNHLIKIITSE